MRQYFILFSMLILFNISAFGQTSVDTISYFKTLGKYNYVYKNNILSLNKMSALFVKHPESAKLVRAYQNGTAASVLLSFVGGFMVGYQIGNVITGKPLNLIAAGGGMVITLSAFAMEDKVKDNVLNAVKLYNSAILKEAAN